MSRGVDWDHPDRRARRALIERDQLIPYDLPLRPGLRIGIVLPADLTTAEAERIAKFVHSLAFPED